MKDSIITARRKKTELITLLACVVLANLINLYAVIHYNTPLTELFTSVGYVTITTLVLYAVWSALRIVVWGALSLIRRNKS